jgi:hypothetical protein
VGKQRAKQSLAVDPVGFDPTPPARDRNRGCIDNMALNSFAQQDTVNPEAVQPRFLKNDNWEGSSGPRARFPPELRKARQQPRDIPGGHAVL